MYCKNARKMRLSCDPFVPDGESHHNFICCADLLQSSFIGFIFVVRKIMSDNTMELGAKKLTDFAPKRLLGI